MMTMNGTESLKALLFEVEKLERARVKISSPLEILKHCIRGALNPQEEVEQSAEPLFYRPPATPPEFPKLKAKYGNGGGALEWIIVQNMSEEDPYRSGGWYSRPMSELDGLKAAGVPERPPTDWERRMAAAKGVK
jgi:hypothetical protein